MPKAKYRSLGGASAHWVDDFSDGHMKAIGTVKLLGALGLVLPAILGIAPVLVPLAAYGSDAVHGWRGDHPVSP